MLFEGSCANGPFRNAEQRRESAQRQALEPAEQRQDSPCAHCSPRAVEVTRGAFGDRIGLPSALSALVGLWGLAHSPKPCAGAYDLSMRMLSEAGSINTYPAAD